MNKHYDNDPRGMWVNVLVEVIGICISLMGVLLAVVLMGYVVVEVIA